MQGRTDQLATEVAITLALQIVAGIVWRVTSAALDQLGEVAGRMELDPVR